MGTADSFLKVGGHESRSPDTGTGPGAPLILVHGITGSIEGWARSIPALAQHHWMLALDLFGSGLSTKPEDMAYTQEEIAAPILDFMDALGIAQAHLAG